MEHWGDGALGKWGIGEMGSVGALGRWGVGEMGHWGNGALEQYHQAL
jgi:hypothetical protein